MSEKDHGGMFDKLRDKAEGALDKFMDDPEKVDKAKSKAQGALDKYIDPNTSEQLTDTAEKALRSFADKNRQE